MPKSQIVLIVDDNRISTRVTSALLQSLGAEVVVAKNGESAIEMVENKAITSVFMNLFIPGMDGYETTRRIREFSSVPIMAITTDEIATLSEEMIEAGFTSVLTKPFVKENVSKLLLKLTELKKSTPIFDQEEFQKTFSDPELRKDIIETFLNEEESDTSRIESAFKSKNKDDIYSAVHYMKGSFTYLKATKIMKITQPILDNLKLGDVEFALKYKNQFIEYYKELVEELKKV